MEIYRTGNRMFMIMETTDDFDFSTKAAMDEANEKVKMTVDLDVAWQDSDPMGYNTIAEIPGTDLKDEIVMLGGHMDSWHSGTGATDNGAGVAVAMEAVRIIQALGLKPRRTIRIGLWSQRKLAERRWTVMRP